MPLIGAHVGASGGVHNCFQNALNIGANCLQIFGASPRQWQASLPDDETLKKYHAARKEAEQVVGKIPVFLHASYLVNLGTPDKEMYEKSIKNLTTHLQIANLLEANGLIYHIGSYKNSTLEESNKRVAEGMLEVLKNAPGKADLIMENASGGGNKMGVTPEEIGDIFRLANHPRIKVCIDTCHAFAGGVLETFSASELENFKSRCEKSFGLKNLTVLHVNDSKIPFGKTTDRHDNLGEGHIGKPAFISLAKDKFFTTLPWILEVPGFNNEGPDTANIEIAKSLLS